MASDLRPDVILIAVGAQPVKPDLPGIDGTNVKSAAQVA
jgi:pyruvate/2-oxoglutarate dehydrogenase complex dihydrolipoamide dehydrogenase (E3) component